MKFLRQVVESRGYDVGTYPPSLLQMNGFSLTVPVGEDELSRTLLAAKIGSLIAKINSEAEMHGEEYELDKFEKFVLACVHRLTLLTLTVKKVAPNWQAGEVKTVQATLFSVGGYNYEVVEWRFKPQEVTVGTSEAAPEGSESCEAAGRVWPLPEGYEEAFVLHFPRVHFPGAIPAGVWTFPSPGSSWTGICGALGSSKGGEAAGVPRFPGGSETGVWIFPGSSFPAGVWTHTFPGSSKGREAFGVPHEAARGGSSGW